MTRSRGPNRGQLWLAFSLPPEPRVVAPAPVATGPADRGTSLERLEALVCREAAEINPGLGAAAARGIVGVIEEGPPWLAHVRAGQLLGQLVTAMDAADVHDRRTLLGALGRAEPGVHPGVCHAELMALHLAAIGGAVGVVEAAGPAIPVRILDALELVLRGFMRAWPFGQELIDRGEVGSPTELYSIVLLRSGAYLEACEARTGRQRRARMTATFERRCVVRCGSLGPLVGQHFEDRQRVAEAILRLARAKVRG